MLKKLGLSTLALAAGMVLFSPQPADAKVRFGVSVGPAYPYYGYTYANPYYYGNPYDPYYNAPVYTYRPPVYNYAAPYYSFGFGWGGHHHVNRGYRGGHRR